MPNEPVPPVLDKLIRAHLPNIGEDVVIGRDDPLSGYGLDSLNMVRLVLQLEHDLGVSIPEELLVPETFATAGSVAGVIALVCPELEIAS